MLGSQVWVHRFGSPLDPEAGWPGLYINVRHCEGLSMVLLPLKDLKELFVNRREFLPSSGFLYDLSCWKQRKTPSLPSYRPHDHQGRPLHKRVETTGVPEGPGFKNHVSNLWWSLLQADHRWCWRSAGPAFNSRGSRYLHFACCSMLHELLQKDIKLCHHLRWKKSFVSGVFPHILAPLYLRCGTRIHTKFVSIQVDVVDVDCCKSMIGLHTCIA